MNRIAVVGLGKLGSCIAACFANAGVFVKGCDLDVEKTQAINEGKAPVDEPQLNDYLVRAHKYGTITATADINKVTADTQACIFVVPTPSLSNGRFDNSFIAKTLEAVAKTAPPDYLFIIASTVAPGSCDREFLPLLAKYHHTNLSYTPQFIALGTVIPNLIRPDFLLVGESNEKSGINAAELWARLHPSGANAHVMSLTEAELAKLALNCALAAKIGLANEIGMLAESLGCDPHRVLGAVGSDHRIGRDYFRYGFAVAGPCLPRDGACLRHVALEVRRKAHLATAADQVNTELLWKIAHECASRPGRIGILGTAYKPGTPHTDRSASLSIARYLTGKGREVRTTDPAAPHTHSLDEALECEIIFVATDWPEYRNLKIPHTTYLIDPAHVIQPVTEEENGIPANNLDYQHV